MADYKTYRKGIEAKRDILNGDNDRSKVLLGEEHPNCLPQ